MALAEFAQPRNLRVRRDACGDPVVLGKVGDVYEHGGGRLGAMWLNLTRRRWGSIRRKLQAAGCRLIHNGDEEGSALFDSANTPQADLVPKLA